MSREIRPKRPVSIINIGFRESGRELGGRVIPRESSPPAELFDDSMHTPAIGRSMDPIIKAPWVAVFRPLFGGDQPL